MLRSLFSLFPAGLTTALAISVLSASAQAMTLNCKVTDHDISAVATSHNDGAPTLTDTRIVDGKPVVREMINVSATHSEYENSVVGLIVHGDYTMGDHVLGTVTLDVKQYRVGAPKLFRGTYSDNWPNDDAFYIVQCTAEE